MSKEEKKKQPKSKCCNAPLEWAYEDKAVVSNIRFLVCSKCKQGIVGENIKE